MDFLLEIGTEEIPARMIDSAREELARRIGELLQRERLSDAPEIEAYSTPRRLAVVVSEVAPAQPDLSEQLTGPSLKVAYKDGKPTPAAEAFARKANVAVDELEKVTTAKGEYLAAKIQRKGRTASDILAESLPKEIAGIYWAKSMYWRGKSAERFVRPVRWLVTLLDGEVVPLEFAGIRAGEVSEGHRILSSGEVSISQPGEYAAALAGGWVIVSTADREHRIRKALDAAARTIPNARWREDKTLFDTVVNLTEFPSAIVGSFDAEFLTLPEEVLVTVMRDHQKYFALEDAGSKLLPHFLAVLNTDGDPDDLIRHGNERVLRARFNDARFFWDADQKIPLRDRVPMLTSVTFQKDLGSYYDKTRRVQQLVSKICAVVNYQASQEQKPLTVRPGVAFKAAHLCKADLTTELVKEFTELQGIIGGLYAKAQELDPILPRPTVEAIALAIYDHYKPESMDDSVPRSLEGGVLAIADKADSIAGMFALGLQPTGSKDPFALRRAANGIVKIIAEHKLPLPISKLFADARAGYAGSDAEKRFATTPDFHHTLISYLAGARTHGNFRGIEFGALGADPVAKELALFFEERLAFYLRDVLHIRYDIVKATLNADRDDIVDAIARARGVEQVYDLPDFESVAAAFKRINNILRQAALRKVRFGDTFEYLFDIPDEEKMLAAKVEGLLGRFRADCTEKNYVGALVWLSTLRPDIDLYFDKVMVMVDDERVRANRLALLRDLLSEFSTIADFSEIVTEGK